MKREKIWYISFILIILFFIVAAFTSIHAEPWRNGDACEYILQTASFENHLSQGITAADVELAKNQFPKFAHVLDSVFDRMRVADNGMSYSNHFGAYSAIVTPIKILLCKLNMNPLYSFKITNLLLWLAAVLTVLLFLKTDSKRKLCIIILLLFNPAFLYIPWIHSEIYIYSFMIIGLVFYYNRQYALGILFVSLASMQNLGTMPVSMIIGLEYIYDLFVNYAKEESKNFFSFLKRRFFRIISYGIFYIPAFIPMILCFSKFHVINLVADEVTEWDYLPTKFIAYLFDPNLGIMPYEPVILVCFFILLIFGIIKKHIPAYLNLLALILILFIVSLEKQINCGMEGVARYNVWIIPLLVFYVAMNFDIEGKKIKKYFAVLCTSALITATMVFVTFAGVDDYNDSMEFAPWTKAIMENASWLYNPTHGIFYSRSLHHETYEEIRPIMYISDTGVKKILLSKESEEEFYSEKYQFADNNGNIIDKKKFKKESFGEKGYKYINLAKGVYPVYEPGQTICFSSDGNNFEQYSVMGFNEPSSWGAWTIGKKVCMLMSLVNNTEASSNYALEIEIPKVYNKSQRIVVIVNDELLFDDKINDETSLQLDFIPKDDIVRIDIYLPDACKPSEVVNSSDNRVVGIGISKMSIIPR